MVNTEKCNKEVSLPPLILKAIIDSKCLCKFLLSLIIGGVIIMLFKILDIDFCENQKTGICQNFINVFSSLIGFIIAGYAIILGFSNRIIRKLCQPYCKDNNSNSNNADNEIINNKARNHFDTLCSSFTMTLISLLITIIASIVFVNRPVVDSWDNFFWIIFIIGLTCFIMVFDLIIHLYTIYTYVRKPVLDKIDNPCSMIKNFLSKDKA